jgi:hypothetical protein
MDPKTDIPVGSAVRFNEDGKKWWKSFRPNMNTNLVMLVVQTYPVRSRNETRRVMVGFQVGLPRAGLNRTFSVLHLEYVT